MALSGLLDLLAEEPTLAAAASRALRGPHPLTVEVRDGAKSAVLGLLGREASQSLVIVTAEDGRAAELAHDVAMWTDARPVLHFPDPDQPAYSMLAIGGEVLAQRVAVLGHLSRVRESGAPAAPIVVTSVRALLRRLVPPDEFRTHFLSLSPGTAADLPDVVRRLSALGYENTPLVERPGEFAHRGGIVDIYPPDARLPIRVDFFGDDIESVRHFDPDTQRSLGPADEVMLTPATEVPIWLGEAVAGRLRELDLDSLRPEDRVFWRRHLEQLEGNEYFDDAAFYTMSLLPDAASLFDYAPDALVVVDEADQIPAAVRDAETSAAANRERLTASGELPTHFDSPLFSGAEILRNLDHAQVRLTFVPGLPGEDGSSRAVVEGFQAQPPYAGRLQHMAEDLLALRDTRARMLIVSYQGRRLRHLLAEQGVAAEVLERLDEPPTAGSVTIIAGTLAEGWRHAPSDVVLISDAELFGRKRIRRIRRGARGVDRSFLADLEKGDYIVHVEHGVGQFEGIVQMSEGSGEREYLAVSYAGEDRLYVPVDQIGRVQKYVGMSERAPKLSRLGTADWTRAKKKAQQSAEEIAAELLDIYAARELAKGYAFPADSPWQHEFDEKFPFIETPDQLEAINDAKADMERARPMDRLVAGDVGYGKTEVALRAVFKAAMNNKQVAVLVPTTVLAQQHFDTFAFRMRDYPLKVELLSRFRARAEQAEVLAGLASGDVNVVVGTHRLLQKDVKFADLGLVVVDEEQRFGVKQKERLKDLRRDVDVLTLTATPIPRTMHMALSGLREISVIESPPERRLAVKTYVAGYSDAIAADAIRRELARGGQVYFLHNRIQTIGTWEERLRNLLPGVDIVVGHGQMPPRDLEEVMYRFARGDAQVLLSTAIIENGLDIPNVNTIIVNDAWRFGLAQLYQLRGRVGRSTTQAYAYFLYQKSHTLTEEAQKRLQTILEASELGAGFRIALRDLEIRGAGSLLGAEQHGHVSTVGFDLYTRMLASAVDRLRGKDADEPDREIRAVVDLPLAAYLPDDYMGTYAAKIREYQRLARLRTIGEVEEAIADIRDRFGDLPEPVANLAYLLRIKARAIALEIPGITVYGRELIIRVPTGLHVSRGILLKEIGRGVRRSHQGLLWPNFQRDREWQTKLLALLDALLRWHDHVEAPPAPPVENAPGTTRPLSHSSRGHHTRRRRAGSAFS